MAEFLQREANTRCSRRQPVFETLILLCEVIITVRIISNAVESTKKTMDGSESENSEKKTDIHMVYNKYS